MPSGIYKRTKLHKENISKVLKGRPKSETTKERMKKNHSHYWKGKKHSKKTKEKIRKALSGEKSYRWKGGISNNPYPLDWRDDLKESIRKRDNYVCQECGIHQDELDSGQVKKLDVHHIDYDKHNLNPENLITLCRRCHIKTNFNRDYWINYFQRKLIV